MKLEFVDKELEKKYYKIRHKANRVMAIATFMSLCGIGLLLVYGIFAALPILLVVLAPIAAIGRWDTQLTEIRHSDGVHYIEF